LKIYFINIIYIYKNISNFILNKKKLFYFYFCFWGLGIGDWGLGIGDWAQSPIPNPQSPIPIPNEFIILLYNLNINFIASYFLL
jgi:hypothetical protein